MKNRRIVVGEDEHEMGEYLTGILTEEGYNVDYSSTPEGVLRRISEADLVVTDQSYGAGKIRGTDVCRMIRSSSRKLPIILASSEVTDRMRRICGGLEVTAIEKRMDEGFRAEFLRAVREALKI
ncbi:MAG: response regulator [Candidatus Pacearchaeota archaeon]|nr:response regulator [Candidatus Pacearchaeota archaeon]